MNKARLIEKIADLVREKKLEGISDIRDESDRQGMRIVIEAQARRALRGGAQQPVRQHAAGDDVRRGDAGHRRRAAALNLKEMLERFIAHRRDVVTRRSRYELRKALARMHIVEGLLVAQDLIDLVVASSAPRAIRDEARWG